MKFNHDIIHLYLQDKELETSSYGWIYDHLETGKHLFQSPDPHRKEVVKEIDRRLVAYDDQLFFNSDIITPLFNEVLKQDNPVTIYLLVGAHPGYDCVLSKDSKGNTICILDILQFANYGPELDKMIYVLRSALTKQMVIHYTQLYYPHQFIKDYHDHLSYYAFCYGLSEFLAWGESLKDYQLSSEKYKEKKEFNFALLRQALQEENPELQKKLQQYAIHNDFWKRFGVISGLFLWDYMYHQGGIETLLYIYQNGWKSFLKKK